MAGAICLFFFLLPPAAPAAPVPVCQKLGQWQRCCFFSLLPCRCFCSSCYCRCCCCCTRCCFAAAAAAAAPTAPPLLPPLAPCVCLVCSPSLFPTKGQPLKGRVPPGSGLSPLWTPTQAAAPFHMEKNGDDDDDVKCFILGKPLK